MTRESMCRHRHRHGSATPSRPLLSEKESAVYRRGRNANPYHHAKNATLEEYLKATALETLCGYLYLKDETARFLELLKAGIERAGIG